MAFQFGAPNQPTTQPGTTGFALPQPQQQQPNPAFGFASPASSTGFNFGAQGAAPSTGFTFGSPATTTSAPTALSFGAPASTSASTGFSFGAQPSVPSGGFSFGQSATAAAPPNTTFGFGQAPPPPAAAAAPAATTTGILFGAPNATAVSSGFNFGSPAPGATTTTATTTASLGFPFSSTPTSTLSFAAPNTTSTSSGFAFGNATTTTSTGTGFSLVTSQPSSSTSSTFTFGQKATAPGMGSGFAFNATSAPAPTTPVASNTAGSLPFSSTGQTFGGGFSFATTKPSAATAPSGFSFPAPPTTAVVAAAASVFAPGQLTTTSILKPPEPFQGTAITTSATALGASLATNSAAPMGFNLNTTPAPAFNTGPPTGFLTTDTNKPAGFAFPLQPSAPAPATGFAFPLQQSASASATGTANFVGTSAATATSNTAVIKPTLSFTGPATSIAPAPFSQAEQAKKPSLTTTTAAAAATTAAPTCAPSSIASGFNFATPSMPATFTSALTTGFPTAIASSLKAPTTTSAPSLLSTTVPFSSAPSPFGGFGVTTSVSLSTATTVTASSAAGATLTTTTTVTAASAAPPPTMNFRQLEDTINKWKIELEEQERVFLNQATQVNAWDKLLITNGEKITELNDAVERVKLDQQRLDHELDFILAQQRELEDLLVPLEKSLESTPNIHHQQHADLEREHTYRLGENIDAQLKRMAEDIKEIIEHLNSSNKGQDDGDPIQQIAKILNAHMDALQWVDQNTAVLRRKLDETSKLYESHR